ncbi:MAG: HEAT repeat domain-containing protein [Planctomycetota bacterium]|nr:HEAT repeat domain-containing protein [Planctomycetota bacterium]
MITVPQVLWTVLVAAVPFLLSGSVSGQAVDKPATPGGAAPQEAGAGPNQSNPYRFEVWHADYPVPLVLPNRNSTRVYERSRRQALEHVAANLSGNCSRSAWQMAMDFFRRAPEDAAEILIQMMDRSFGQPAFADVVKNSIEAMGQMELELFDDALRRALEHPNLVVRQAVYGALVGSGKDDTVRLTYPALLSSMDGKGRQNWLRAARLRLGDEAVEMFRKLMVPTVPLPVRDMVVQETMKLDPEDGALIFEEMWPSAEGHFKTLIAGVMHAAGRTSGTLWLGEALNGDDVQSVVHAMRQLQAGGPGPLMDQVLALSNHPRPEVRLELARLLAKIPGDASSNVLEVLASPDEVLQVRKAAIRELTRRGRTDVTDFLLEDLETATGTRMQLQLDLLAASGDARAVEVFKRRFLASPAEEGRSFLQALAFCGAPGAAEALIDLFLEEERAVSAPRSSGGQLTTVNYIPILLPNLRGSEAALVAGFDRIPPNDYARRALYMQVLAGVASDRTDPAIVEPILQSLRDILFDADELPQLRVQALNALTRRWLTLQDAMRLKRAQEPIGDRETPSMRALFKDFLFEYF